jgi:hypothetical protein
MPCAIGAQAFWTGWTSNHRAVQKSQQENRDRLSCWLYYSISLNVPVIPPQGSTGAAYRISDFPCFADMSHKPLMDSILSYYFGRIPFPLKQTHPLDYSIKNFCFLPDCTKRLFFGNGKQKRAIEQPSPRLIYISFGFYRFYHMQTRKPFTLSRKLLYYHENSQQVSVIIQAVSMFVYGFCLRVSTFAW